MHSDVCSLYWTRTVCLELKDQEAPESGLCTSGFMTIFGSNLQADGPAEICIHIWFCHRLSRTHYNLITPLACKQKHKPRQ